MQWRDVSIPLRAGMTVWPGDQPFSFEPAERIANGSEVNTSVVTMSSHTGTHCDAPWHFEEEGKRLHEVDPNFYFGPARVIDCEEAGLITPEILGDRALPQRLLLKTRNSDTPIDGNFDEAYVGVAPAAARRMVDEGVRLVGVDYLSVAPFSDPAPTHHILLQNEVFIVEGLRLAGVTPGEYEFVVLPLPLFGADGAPCRAFLGEPD